MRRTDREVKSINNVYDILSRCKIIRVAMNDSEVPYVVPVNFGLERDGDRIIIYFHSAVEGHKAELLKKDNRVFIEADLYYKVEETLGGITQRYESVMGCGTAEQLTETADKVHGLKLILSQYSKDKHPVEECKGLSLCTVYRVVLDQVSGKQNLS
jgi:uncharacterized protein